MQFKYIGQVEGVDHALSVEIKQGADIKLNGKPMKYDAVLQKDDVLTVKDKNIIEKLQLTGLYEETSVKKQISVPNTTAQDGD